MFTDGGFDFEYHTSKSSLGNEIKEYSSGKI